MNTCDATSSMRNNAERTLHRLFWEEWTIENEGTGRERGFWEGNNSGREVVQSLHISYFLHWALQLIPSMMPVLSHLGSCLLAFSFNHSFDKYFWHTYHVLPGTVLDIGFSTKPFSWKSFWTKQTWLHPHGRSQGQDQKPGNCNPQDKSVPCSFL